MTESILVTRDGPLQIVRMNRPEKKNALTSAMYGRLSEALHCADDDEEILCTIFLGHPGVFTAGNDLKEFLAYAQGGALGVEVMSFLHALAKCRKPMVAGVDGIAVGVGTTMLLHCDYVVASDRASLSTPFVGLGLVPEAASSLIAPRLMGHARAFELLVMGRAFNAARAREAGIVNEVVAPEALEAAAISIGREIASRPRAAVLQTRWLLRGPADEIVSRMDIESECFSVRLRSAEAAAAFGKFLSKSRQPQS